LNILQVLSQFEVTGAETFAATLADTQIAEGHSVFIISDNFYTKTKAQIILHPIGKRDVAQRWKNVSFLKDFIRQHKIDVVHAHSRAASWVCYFATRSGNIPLVSSIHGRQHLHFSSKMFSVYGEKRVAVCKSIYDHLNRDLKYPLDSLALVHNGIDLSAWKFEKHAPPKRAKKIVSFVGRLSGFKGDTLLIIVEQIFPKIFEQYRNVEFHIIGGMNEKSKIIPAIERTNERVGTEFIIAKGFCSDVERVYRDSDLIVGSGRVAMEALACGSPVVSIGESNYVGIISAETEREALITNFGDLDARRPIDVERSVRSILSALEHPEAIPGEWGRTFIEKNFEINSVAAQMNVVYAEAVAKKKGINEIPVLSYLRISENNVGGEERTLHCQEFEAQLRFLALKGFTALTFYDIDAIRSLKRPLPDKPVILTFDSYEDNFTFAFPLLKKYGFTGAFFLQTNFLNADGKPALTFDHAAEMHAGGMEIGSASHSRPKMNLIPENEFKTEITDSKTLIEKRLKTPVITFAYPYGFVNEKVKQTIKGSGYLFAVAIDEGRRNFWFDFLKIRRIQIFGGASQFSFWKKTSGRYLWYKYVY
jgi:peptidoglycan/xylan/chitin deacetylase (PgdA/CDA1 family)/glycosyltransferase involved in cell wall biosynthesis